MSEFYAEDSDDGWADLFSAPAEETAPVVEGTTEPEAVAEPEVAPTEAVENAETEKQDRARDEKGRFAKQEEEQPQELILGKFKTAEDLAKSYQEAERRLHELAQRDREREEQLQQRLAAIEQGIQRQPAQGIDWDTELERDPVTAFDTALAQYEQNPSPQTQSVLHYVAGQWNDLAPGAPKAYARAIAAERQAAQLAQQMQPMQETEADRFVARGIRAVEEQYGPLNDIVERARTANIPQSVAQDLYQRLEHGSPDQKVAAIETLALLSGGRPAPAADNLAAETLKGITLEQAREADRAIAEAAVASATQTRPEPPKQSAADLVWGAADEEERVRQEGWNI